MSRISGSLHGTGRLSGVLSGGGRLSGGISKPTMAQVEEYTGDYEFTPSRSTQVIEIANKKATADIIINPIPSNYGLVTWNGSALTVS